MSRKIEMAGKRFGRLVVLSQAGHNPGNHDLLWRCQCDCGNQTVVDGALLRSGQTKSCGCLRREISKQNYVTNTGFVSQMGRAESLVGRIVNSSATFYPNKLQMVFASLRPCVACYLVVQRNSQFLHHFVD